MKDLVGFYIGLHDSNIAALKDGELLYRKFERRSGVKHERVTGAEILATIQEWGIKPSAIAFSDGNRNRLGSVPEPKLWDSVTTVLAPNSFILDHHYAHALSGWPAYELPHAYTSFVLDGRGDHEYKAQVFRINSDLGLDNVLWKSKDFGVGKFFTQVGYAMGLDGAEVDFAGKVMGLQAYGNVDVEFLYKCDEYTYADLPKLLPDLEFKGVRPMSRPKELCIPENRLFVDWLQSCHVALGMAILKLFKEFAVKDEFVEFTGGCAQNSIYNEMLTWQFPKLAIPAHCYDGGLSLGCLGFLMRYYGIEGPQVPDYPFIQDDEDCGFADPNVQEDTAVMIAEGKIVGWMQGHGEIGPRALGHRSILFDPTLRDAKKTLNSRVKFREKWRPFAASVLEDEMGEWFATKRPSPWMQRALVVRPSADDVIPGVIHQDKTCRAQTVDAEDPQLASFAGVLDSFAKIVGDVPLVLNTSLNTGGQPIYGQVDQGLELLRSGRIDTLVVGNKVLNWTAVSKVYA